VTTENDFQRALNKNPEDWQTRLVFADWLQEHNDPRAEGYRALGSLRTYPFWMGVEKRRTDVSEHYRSCPFWTLKGTGGGHLPADWFALIVLRGKSELYAPLWAACRDVTRREAEDAAALAFGRLPDERRTELLTATSVEPNAEYVKDRLASGGARLRVETVGSTRRLCGFIEFDRLQQLFGPVHINRDELRYWTLAGCTLAYDIDLHKITLYE
jgi:uncharacterized protein (TIGR02996 family)